MKCNLVQRHVGTYLDGELAPSSLIEFEHHLQDCSECQHILEFERIVKAQVKKRLQGISAPDSFRSRIKATIDRSSAISLSEFRVRSMVQPMLGLAAAAALFLFFNLYSNRADNTSPQAVVNQSNMILPVFEDVVRRHSVDLPTEIKAEESDKLVSWFRGKVRFPVHLVKFAEPQVNFVGARLSHVQDRQAATLYYNVNGQRLTMVVFEPSTPLVQGAHHITVGGRVLYYRDVYGYTVPVIQRNGVAYAFTSDLDRSSLLKVVASARIP